MRKPRKRHRPQRTSVCQCAPWRFATNTPARRPAKDAARLTAMAREIRDDG